MEKVFKKKTIEWIFAYLWYDLKDKLCISLINKMYGDQLAFINYLNKSFELWVHTFDFTKNRVIIK